MWTMNFQIFKLVLEKTEEPEIKLPTSTGSWKKQESSRKSSISALLTMPKPLTVWITIDWKILKEMGTPDHLTCLLRNLYAGEEAIFRTGNETTDWFQIGKGVCQACILSSCLFKLYVQYIIRNTGLEDAQAGIKIARRNVNNLRYGNDTTLMAEIEEELKSLWRKWKKRVKSWLKAQHSENEDHGIWSNPFMANRWGSSGNSDRVYFGELQITADGNCSHEIKRRLLLGRKVMTNLDSIFKSRDITLPTKLCLVKVMVFPVAMYGCESWTIKKAEILLHWCIGEGNGNPLQCSCLENPRDRGAWWTSVYGVAQSQTRLMRLSSSSSSKQSTQ